MVRPTCKVNGKGQNLTPYWHQNPWNFSNLNQTTMIMSTRSTPVQIFISIRSAGASLQIGEKLRVCDFFPSWLVILYFSWACARRTVDGFSRFMAHTLCFRPGQSFLGWRQYRNSFGVMSLKTTQNGVWIGNFKPDGPNIKSWYLAKYKLVNLIVFFYVVVYCSTICMRFS